MARNVRSGPLESRTSRGKLPSRNAPYWCVLSPSVALGYRKGARGGAWLARLHDDETGKRVQEKIGKADDTLDADGLTVLSFPQAQAKVREWAAAKAREMSGEVLSAGPYTVADAIRDYLDWFDRHRKGGASTRSAVNAFILPALGEVDTRKLTRRRIEAWLHALADSPARLRTRPGAPQRFRDTGDDPEAPRRRRATANRVLTILKAALNHALKARRIANDDAWRHGAALRRGGCGAAPLPVGRRGAPAGERVRSRLPADGASGTADRHALRRTGGAAWLRLQPRCGDTAGARVEVGEVAARRT